jgi:flagellin
LATQAASDTVGDTERGFVDLEVQQLKKELERISLTTEYTGTKFLNGSASTLDFQVGVNGDDNSRISFDAGGANATLSALNISGVAVASKDDARDTLDSIDQAISKVAAMRANFGAIQSRMQTTINNISTYRENLSAANSRIRDADMAAEAANLAKTTILQQAGVATLAQANQTAGLAMKLL